MNAATQKKQTLLVFLLTVAAVALLAVIYYTPIWWVSLTAPNYPPEAFPDGVRIDFHMNGVFNGCKKVEKQEIEETEALNCVHEMDTINHYVGMYPIAAGGVIERAFSPFLMTMLGVMLVGFACTRPKIRMAVMGLGFAAIVVWMYLTFYGSGGLRFENQGYVSALVTALDQDTEEEAVRRLGKDQALRMLRESLGRETGDLEQAPAETRTLSEKEQQIEHLRATFERDQERKPEAEREPWNGSGFQLLSWHYGKTLGRYFNNPAEIRPMVAGMTLASRVVFWGLVGAMGLLLWGARKNRGLLYWLLVIVPLALPLFFIVDYSAWLWWYGHRLNAMGAFTVKPFMPTVFGDGKVAQFTTHSYPYKGFGLMLAMSVLLTVAALVRRKQFQDTE